MRLIYLLIYFTAKTRHALVLLMWPISRLMMDRPGEQPLVCDEVQVSGARTEAGKVLAPGDPCHGQRQGNRLLYSMSGGRVRVTWNETHVCPWTLRARAYRFSSKSWSSTSMPFADSWHSACVPDGCSGISLFLLPESLLFLPRSLPALSRTLALTCWRRLSPTSLPSHDAQYGL